MKIINIIENIEEELPTYIIRGTQITISPGKNSEKTKDIIESVKDQYEFNEGGISEITIELHKRDPNLRKQAIDKYGYSCYVCNSDLQKLYGDLELNCFEVHHLEPISKQMRDRVYTVEDVRVVCANCHRILHKNGAEPIDVEVLKQTIEKQRKK